LIELASGLLFLFIPGLDIWSEFQHDCLHEWRFAIPICPSQAIGSQSYSYRIEGSKQFSCMSMSCS
jgi:hypothetical protein